MRRAGEWVAGRAGECGGREGWRVWWWGGLEVWWWGGLESVVVRRAGECGGEKGWRAWW